MNKKIFTLFTLVGLVGLQASSSFSATSDLPSVANVKISIAKLKKDCAKDVDKFCKGVTPGEGRIADCLSSREDQLSPTCKTSWLTTEARISKKWDQTELAFRTNCGGDVQKFCSDVPSGGGRIFDCLSQHEDGLSNSCKNLQTKIEKNISELLG